MLPWLPVLFLIALTVAEEPFPNQKPGEGTIRLRAFLNDFQPPPNAPPKETAIVLTLDGSGSISEESWDAMVDFVGDLVTFLPPTTKLGVLVYSSSVQEVGGFNIDPKTTFSKLKAMRQPKEGTKTGAALREVLKMFNGDRSDVKMSMLLTDGESQDDVVGPTKDLIEMNIRCIAIGFGKGVSRSTLISSSSSPSDAYLMDSIQDVLAALHEATTSRTQTYYGLVSFVPTITGISTFRDDFKFQLEVRNIHAKDVIPKGTRIEMTTSNGKHFASNFLTISKDLKHGESEKLQAKLLPNGVTSLATLPERINLEFIDPKKNRINSEAGGIMLMPNYFMTASLNVIKKAKRLNIGVFGPMGSGKTTVINGLLNMIEDGDKWREYLPTMSAPFSVTTDIFHQIPNGDWSALKFVDTEGTGSPSWAIPGFFEQYIYGILPVKHEISQGCVKFDGQVKPENYLQVLLIVVKSDWVTVEKGSEVIEALKLFILRTAQSGVKILVVVTGTEKLALEDVDPTLKYFVSLLGVGEWQVFPFGLKNEGGYKSFDTNMDSAVILEGIVTAYEAFLGERTGPREKAIRAMKACGDKPPEQTEL